MLLRDHSASINASNFKFGTQLKYGEWE